MKTAVSVPDPIFRRAEQLSKRLGISRSELYSQAVAAFIKAHDPQEVTAALDAVYSEHHSELEPDIVRLQAASIRPEVW